MFWLKTLFEEAYFPFWEAYVLFVTIFFVSIVIRLSRIEDKVDNINITRRTR